MLLRHYLRREARGLLGWSLVIPIVVLPVVGIYRLLMNSESMQEFNRTLADLPPALKGIVGGDSPLSTLDAWLQAQVFGFLVPLLLTIYTAMGALGVLTREMDGRTMDFLLALPVRRTSVVLSRLGGLALNLAVLHGVLLLSVGAGVNLVGAPVAWSTYALVLLNQYLIFVALAALLVLITVFVDDLQKGLMTVLGVALILFFLPHLVTADSPLGGLTRLSFFHYYQPQAVLAHGALPWSDVATLLLALAACAGGAVWLFGRKQLTA